jgi:hypothetical protein
MCGGDGCMFQACQHTALDYPGMKVSMNALTYYRDRFPEAMKVTLLQEK